MTRQVAHNLAGTGRVRHEREVAEIKMIEQSGQIVGERVVVVAVP
jgi:hypothetical protein